MVNKQQKKKIISGLCALLAAGILMAWENNALQISKYIVQDKTIPENFEGYKIVQLSDFHNKGFGKNADRLYKKVKQQSPDAIVITGDLADNEKDGFKRALLNVKRMTEIATVYYVTGNHEYWLSEDTLKILYQSLRDMGVIILNNDYVTISKGGQIMYLVGLDDNNLKDGTLKTITEEINNSSDGLKAADAGSKYIMLLAHEPQYIDHYANSSVNLVFSGHAHGGQFRIPFVGGLGAPGQGFFPKLTAGMHQKNNTTMVISRGLGNSIIPVRIFNRPEIVCVKLHKFN